MPRSSHSSSKVIKKLKAAIRTLGYVTELLENREATLETLRRLLCQFEHGQDW